MVRNRVGGPVVNETEHKNQLEQRRSGTCTGIVQRAGTCSIHGPPGLDSVPPIVGSVPS